MFSDFTDRLKHRSQQLMSAGKRLLYVMSPRQTEQIGQEQYQEAIRPLGERLQNALNAADIRQEVQQAIQDRTTAVERTISPMIQASQGNTENITALQGILNGVRDRLNTLKSQLLLQLSVLGVNDQARQLQQQYRTQYQQFANRLIGISTSTPPTTNSPTGRGRTAPADSLSTGRTAQPRQTTTPQVEQLSGSEISPEQERQLMRQFYRFSTEWAGEGWVPGERVPNGAIQDFARSMWYHVVYQNSMNYQGKTGREAGLTFLSDMMGGVNAINSRNRLRDIVRGGYLIYEHFGQTRYRADQNLRRLFRSNPRNAHRQLRREFFGNVRVSNTGTLSHPSGSSSITSASASPQSSSERRSTPTPSAVEQQFRQEVARGAETIPRNEENATLGRVETALANGDVPSREDLVRIQGLVNRVNNEIMDNDHQLSWVDVDSARMAHNAQYDRRRGVTSRARMLIGGRLYTIEPSLEPLDRSNPNRRNTLLSVRHRDGHNVDVDLPRLMGALQTLRDRLPSVTNGRPDLNLGEVANAVQTNPEALREEMSTQRYHSYLDAVGISPENREYYENVPQALARLLRIPTNQLNRPRPISIWKQAINALQWNENMSADEHKFLWVMRMYVRTREVSSDQPVNLQEFSNMLLRSRSFTRTTKFDTPTTVSRLMEANLALKRSGAITASEAADRNAHLNREYNSFLNELPRVKELFDFARLLREKGPQDGNGRSMHIIPWSIMSQQLTLAADMPAETLINGQRYIVIDHGAAGGNQMISRDVIRTFQRLQRENPLFQDLIALGQASARPLSPSTPNMDDSYEGVLQKYYTPMGATWEGFGGS